MRYICQLDYPDVPYRTRTDTPDDEYGQNTTVRSSGCGLCSAIMVADRLLFDYKFDLDDALALAFESGANHATGTDYSLYAPAFAEKFSFRYEKTDDPQRLRECLREGGAAVAHVAEPKDKSYIGVFTHGGHFIAVISEEADGRFCILDPSLKEGKFDEDGRRGKVEVKGHLCFCTEEVLQADTNARAGRRYHLFWRS